MVNPNYVGQPAPAMYSGVPQNADSSLYDRRPGDQPMYPVQHHLPIEYHSHHGKSYLTFVYNPVSGDFERDSSPDLTNFKHSLLDGALVELRKYVQQNEPLNIPNAAISRHSQGVMYGDLMVIDDSVKRARSETLSLGSNRREKPRPHKARKIKTKLIIPGDDDDDDVILPNASFTSTATEQPGFVREEMVTYTVNDTEKWKKWFCDAFRALQQLGCRTMAKEWIKIIHPKKQSTNPYNGKKLKQGTGNPESTKPSYWPKDVIHREPDHINKEDRTNLLLHLLMGTPHKVMCPPGAVSQEKDVDAAALMAALEGKYEDKKYGLQGRRALVDMIIYVRTQMENYKLGGLTAETEITVVDYANFRKPHSVDDGESNETETIDVTDGTLELTSQPEGYNDGDTMVLTPASDHHSPMMTEMPVSSETPQMVSKKTGVRKKTKKGSRQRDSNLQNVSFSGSTSTIGSHHMLPNSFDTDQMARHPDQTPSYAPAMWNANMTPSSNPMAPYQYPAHFEPPDPRLIHIQTQYPAKDFVPVPISSAQLGQVPEYYIQQQQQQQQQQYLNMAYNATPNLQGYQPDYAYYG